MKESTIRAIDVTFAWVVCLLVLFGLGASVLWIWRHFDFFKWGVTFAL